MRVRLNLGDGAFGPETIYPVNHSPVGLASADLNGDGIPDLVVTCLGASPPTTPFEKPAMVVMLGRGNGTFELPVATPLGVIPSRQAPARVPSPLFMRTLTELFQLATSTSRRPSLFMSATAKPYGSDQSNGAGGAWLDYDGDGLPDLFLVNSGPMDGVTHHKPGTVREPNRLYHNLGQGRFEDVTAKAGVAGAHYGTAAVAADYDNDGHTDLLVLHIGGCALYHNRGDGTFEDVTARSHVTNPGGSGIGAVFLDYDNDGLLDILVANYLAYDPNYKEYFQPDGYPGPLSYAPQFNVLYRNLGNGVFEDVSEAAGIRIPGHRAMSVAVLDYNQDGFPDLYFSNDGTPNTLLVNDGHGRFKDMALQAGVAFITENPV